MAFFFFVLSFSCLFRNLTHFVLLYAVFPLVVDFQPAFGFPREKKALVGN